MTEAQLCMIIFLNKIIFLPRVKDSLLPTNLCQENQSRWHPGSVVETIRFILGTMERHQGKAKLEGLRGGAAHSREADLHDNHHYGSSVVPASTLNQMRHNSNSSRAARAGLWHIFYKACSLGGATEEWGPDAMLGMVERQVVFPLVLSQRNLFTGKQLCHAGTAAAIETLARKEISGNFAQPFWHTSA